MIDQVKRVSDKKKIFCNKLNTLMGQVPEPHKLTKHVEARSFVVVNRVNSLLLTLKLDLMI